MTTTELEGHEVVDRVIALARERLPDDQSKVMAEFLRHYFGRVSAADLEHRDPLDLLGAALEHWRLGQRRPAAEAKVRVTNPNLDETGWQSVHTVVDIVTDDMPFLVDSVSMALHRQACGLHLVVHPLLDVERDESGALIGLGDGPPNEAWMHFEVDRRARPDQLHELEAAVVKVLRAVRATIDDWRAMHDRLIASADALDAADDGDSEGGELLRWFAADHFTFLGALRYDLDADAALVVPDPASGLGLLRPDFCGDLQPGPEAPSSSPLVITRAVRRSAIHRDAQLVELGVQRRDDSGVVGEDRFVGLYTAAAYRKAASDIPYLHRKIDAVLDRSGLPRDSHSGRELWNILETFPRDDLFEIDDRDLSVIADGILNLQERKQVRLFCRRDARGRFVSCLVYLPRDRYSTRVVEDIEAVLVEALGGVSADYETRITDSVLGRVHYLVRLGPDAPDSIDVHELERRLGDVARWWVDDLRDALIDALGEEEGLATVAHYGEAFPPAYRAVTPPRSAVNDLRRLQRLDREGGMTTALQRSVEAAETEWRFKLYTTEAVTLSSVVPLLEHLGVEVVDERPYAIRPDEGPPVWLYDMGVRSEAGAHLADAGVREEFRVAFAAAWRGGAESDGFDRLVLTAGLRHREVVLIRAYAKYLRQTGMTFSQAYLEQTLAKHAAITRRIVDLFVARFDPDLDGHRPLEAGGIASEIVAALEGVASLDEDRILRAFLMLVEATTRTNFFLATSGEPMVPAIAFKFDPSRVPDLPMPRPRYEIWTYSPRMEGVHLRGGPIARGGLRWSDRREDFRTEVLGLMKAQMVKNAVIVPVGAKGGFVVKRPAPSPEAQRTEVAACYRMFVSALLDVTDNIVDGVVVPPARVVRHDGDDPYLVVAADKGTATFSDLANTVAQEHGFWLGDAFASGGSTGYDHKVMGITARGAWESVRRHFRSLGVDADTTEITVVGIGDMSGDVFGNGMLMSPHLQLLAAFDHRHVFLDPDPDPAASFAERQRLYQLPRSSWDDYDRGLISAGGGVFPRSAKSVPLTAEVRHALGIDAMALTPNELLSAILRAPVDLLWNGGIGTYVKASSESHADVGDRANDAVRIDALDLRCRVVAEGGNLGFTQRGRIEYARAGGLINTDAIDNSAGVDCSDHEVNIKIALDRVVAAGDLTEKQRNQILVDMTEEVAELVLDDNVDQNIALAIARTQAGPMMDVHARYVRHLEHEGLIDRELEALPTDKQFADRQGEGLTAPEFAVLLAYTKMIDVAEVLKTELPEEAYLEREVHDYFPTLLNARIGDAVLHHPLRREIIATRVVNRTVNWAGTSFGFRMAEETGASVADIVRAHVVAAAIFSMGPGWEDIRALDGAVDGGVQIEMWLALRRCVERSVSWLLRQRRPPIDMAGTVATFRPGVEELTEQLPRLLSGRFAHEVTDESARLVGCGVPADLAVRAASWPLLHTSFDVIEVARARGRTPAVTSTVYWSLLDQLDLAWLWDRIGALPRNDRWQMHARLALRDELLRNLRDLTDEVLRAGDVFTNADDLFDRWHAANQRAADRAQAVFADIRANGVFDLTTLSVALRQLSNLVVASAPAA
jgi:glutamate dehydrogenase